MLPKTSALLFSLVLSAPALAVSCPLPQIADDLRTVFTCDSEGHILSTENRFLSNGNLSSRETQISATQHQQETFNFEGQRVSLTRTETLANGDERRSSINVKNGRIDSVDILRNQHKIGQEIYREGILQTVEDLDNLERPLRRRLIEGAHIKGTAEFV